MATTTRTSIVEALRYTYGSDRVNLILNEEMVTWNIFKKRQKSVGGRGQNIIPIYVKLPEGISGITEGGTLPTALAADTAEAVFSLQEIAGVYQVSWKLIQDSETDRDAFEQAVALMDRGIRTAMVQDLSNEMLDDGRGRLAVLSAADDNAQITNLSFQPRVRQGMVVDVMDTDDDTVHGNSLTVTAVNPITPSFTLSGAPSGTAANDYVVRENTTDDSQNDALHLNGLLGIIDDADPATVVGDYGGIDRGTAGNEFWESAVLANGGTNRSLTSDLLLQAMDSIRLKGTGKADAILMNLPIRRRYVELFDATRFVDTGTGAFSGDVGPSDATKKSETGKSDFTFGGVPIHVDTFAPNNTVFVLDTSTFQIAYGRNKVPQPISELFGVDFFTDTSSAAFDVRWYWQGELICESPAANAKIEDVAES